MKNMYKKMIYTLSVFAISLVYGQELTNEHKQMLKYDNTGYFNSLITKENINNCFKIEDTSYSLLSLAIKMNSKEVFQKLIEEKADLEKVCDGKTPLMFAAKYGNTEMAKKLLAAGAKKDAKTERGYTALDYAKKYEKPEIIKILE